MQKPGQRSALTFIAFYLKAIRRITADDEKMLKQLSDKLNNVFYKGPELKNMMETIDNFRRSATREEELLKENDGKVYLKQTLCQRMVLFYFISCFCMIPIILIANSNFQSKHCSSNVISNDL